MATKFEAHLEAAVSATLDEAVRIAEIAAPTFEEQARAEYVEACFAEIGGWDSLTRDRMGNVVAIRRGDPARGRVLAAAHLDTVFPDPEVSIRRARGKLLGPGIGDNSLSVAVLLAVGGALRAAPPRNVGDILLAANASEEGRGDLRGIRAIAKSHEGQFDRMRAVEGLARDRVQTGFVGSNRYKFTVETEDGHSWGAPPQRDPAARTRAGGARRGLSRGRHRAEGDDERRRNPRRPFGEYDRTGRDDGDRPPIRGCVNPRCAGRRDEAGRPKHGRPARWHTDDQAHRQATSWQPVAGRPADRYCAGCAALERAASSRVQ